MKKTLTTLALMAAFTTPAFALDLGAKALVSIGGNGEASVHNAEVTSVSGNTINAITRFKDSLLSWTFTTNASTTIGKGQTTSDIRVGDHIDVRGMITSFGSTMSVAASKIANIGSSLKAKLGTVESVNSANGTFVMKYGEKSDKKVTVQTNASTSFALMTAATSTPAAATFANIAANSKVQVTGTLSSDGTVLTANKVLILPANLSTKTEKKLNNGVQHGLKKGWDHNIFANVKAYFGR